MKNNELYPKAISEILGEKFFIPEYQRGYRWDKRQVVNMLDDIYEFYIDSRNKDANVFYCLQPVVIKKKDDEWELIDGQQRLTTLYLILTYFKELMNIFGKEKLNIRYVTREESEKFLENIDKDLKEKNIDFFHICNAYDAIEEWFEGKDGTLKSNLLQTIVQPDEIGKNVKVIWYEVHEDADPIDIFTRLNVGKIPLTNAELVKALFLRKQNLSSNETSLLQLKIAQDWDLIENKLHADDFWYFISNSNNYSTRIEYILKLMADEFFEFLHQCNNIELPVYTPRSKFLKSLKELIKDPDNTDYSISVTKDDPYYIFFVFNKMFELTGKQSELLWIEIKKYFMTFEEWYEDRYYFHIIGFLIKADISPLEIMNNANSSETKQLFKDKLKELILNVFDLNHDVSVEDIEDSITSLKYDSNRAQIRKFLLLFNILSLIEDPASNSRFQFNAFSEQAINGGWDLEHIHSVSSRKPERVDDRKLWLKNVLVYLTGEDNINVFEKIELDHDDEDLSIIIYNLLKTEPFDPQGAFDDLYNAIIKEYGDTQGEDYDVDNSIANLALLDAATNRSYKNAIFPIKRNRIIELDKKATFVPLCTKNAFLKYFSKKADKMFRWEESDGKDYLNSIIATVAGFLVLEDDQND